MKANLVRNPGFENGLDHWSGQNARITDRLPYAGSFSAELGSGAATLTQVIKVDDDNHHYLLHVAAMAPLSADPGALTVTVEWLGRGHRRLGPALQVTVPSVTLGAQFFWLTWTEVADAPPRGTRYARVLIEKGEGSETDLVEIDQVILTPLTDD